MASNYNKVPRPAVVFVRDGVPGSSSAARRPTTSSDSTCHERRRGGRIVGHETCERAHPGRPPRLRERRRRVRAPRRGARRRHRGARRRRRSRSPGSRCATSSKDARRARSPRTMLHRRRRASVVADPDVDVVVEVIGGLEPARTLILDALKRRQAGRHRQQGAARQRRPGAVRRRRERRRRPAVRGVASPAASRCIRPLRESLAGDRIRRVDGHRQRHDELHPHPHDRGRLVVRGRARRGADSSGTPSPIRPPMSRATTRRPRPRSSPRSRSARASSPTTCTARASPRSPPTTSSRPRRSGYVVKLLAVAEERDGEVAVRVHPAMVPLHHPLASVRESFNAVFIEGEAVGELMLYGRGAGGGPTASRAARRPHRRGQEPGRRGARARRSGELVARPIRADRRDRVAVLPAARGRRPPGRARGDRRRVRRARRVDQVDAAARASATTPGSSSSRTGPARRTCRATLERLRERRAGAPRRLGAARRR